MGMRIHSLIARRIFVFGFLSDSHVSGLLPSFRTGMLRVRCGSRLAPLPPSRFNAVMSAPSAGSWTRLHWAPDRPYCVDRIHRTQPLSCQPHYRRCSPFSSLASRPVRHQIRQAHNVPAEDAGLIDGVRKTANAIEKAKLVERARSIMNRLDQTYYRQAMLRIGFSEETLKEIFNGQHEIVRQWGILGQFSGPKSDGLIQEMEAHAALVMQETMNSCIEDMIRSCSGQIKLEDAVASAVVKDVLRTDAEVMRQVSYQFNLGDLARALEKAFSTKLIAPDLPLANYLKTLRSDKTVADSLRALGAKEDLVKAVKNLRKLAKYANEQGDVHIVRTVIDKVADANRDDLKKFILKNRVSPEFTMEWIKKNRVTTVQMMKTTLITAAVASAARELVRFVAEHRDPVKLLEQLGKNTVPAALMSTGMQMSNLYLRRVLKSYPSARRLVAKMPTANLLINIAELAYSAFTASSVEDFAKKATAQGAHFALTAGLGMGLAFLGAIIGGTNPLVLIGLFMISDYVGHSLLDGILGWIGLGRPAPPGIIGRDPMTQRTLDWSILDKAEREKINDLMEDIGRLYGDIKKITDKAA